MKNKELTDCITESFGLHCNYATVWDFHDFKTNGNFY